MLIDFLFLIYFEILKNMHAFNIYIYIILFYLFIIIISNIHSKKNNIR